MCLRTTPIFELVVAVPARDRGHDRVAKRFSRERATASHSRMAIDKIGRGAITQPSAARNPSNEIGVEQSFFEGGRRRATHPRRAKPFHHDALRRVRSPPAARQNRLACISAFVRRQPRDRAGSARISVRHATAWNGASNLDRLNPSIPLLTRVSSSLGAIGCARLPPALVPPSQFSSGAPDLGSGSRDRKLRFLRPVLSSRHLSCATKARPGGFALTIATRKDFS